MAMPGLDSVVSYLRRVTPDAGASDDELLLARFRAGDELAFAALVHRYSGLVWSVCRRTLSQTADAEDAFQATFLILTRKARSLGRGGPLGPWLHTVASRTAIKARARSLRRASRETDTIVEPAGYDPPLDDSRGLLDEEIGKLPEKYRLPVILCYLEGLTNEQAAERLGCPRGTILSRLSRARDQLRQRLQRRGVDLPRATPTLPTVPAALLETVARTNPQRAISDSVLTLAEGVMLNMSVNKFKAFVLTILVAAIAGGAGLWASRPAAAPLTRPDTGPNKSVTKAEEEKEPVDKKKKKDDKVEKKPALTASNFHAALNKEIEFRGFEGSMRLTDALDHFAQAFDLQFDINEAAFKEEGLNEARESEINIVPLRAMKVSLRKVLAKVLSRVPAPSGATFMIRKDHIEITTENAVRRELGLPARKLGEEFPLEPMTLLVWREIQKEPLSTALSKIAEDLDINIVIDSRVEDKSKVEVTASLHNVSVETALKLLTHMAGLVFVKVENVYYVTSPENAAKLKK